MKRFAVLAALTFSLTLVPVGHTSAMPQGSTLDDARTQAAAGNLNRAVQLFQQVLKEDRDNIVALRGLTDALVAQGHWQTAIEPLQHLDQLQPNDAARVFQLGQMESWQSGHRDQALTLLKRANELDPSNLQYQKYYAQVLSWNAATRPEAIKIYQRGLRESPNDMDLLMAYAEMLSWNRATRAEAMDCYKKALAQDPHNVRALSGEAQLLSWSGHSSEAMDIYSQILSQDPNNVVALRGEAQILGWRGDYRHALTLAQQAHALDGSDPATTLELAQAEYDMGHYAEAKSDLAQVQGMDTPDYVNLKREVDHALGTYIELGYALRRDGGLLDYDSADALVSTPLGSQNRLSALYQPFRYRTNQGDFSSNYYALMLDSQPSDTVTTDAQIAGRTYPGVPSQIEGAFDAAFTVRPSFKLQMGFDRESDQETLVSTLGADEDGVFVGQVETNLATIGGSYSNSQHHYDVSLDYTDGVYTGQNLASNRRWGFDGNVGKSIRGDHPYIRIGYGFSYVSFDHDAEFVPGDGQPPRITGGYYSPTEYLLNYGQLLFSGNLGPHAKWDLGGFAGMQNAQTFYTSFSTPQFASTFSTHLTWSITANNELRLGYDYLNTFNAFHRHLFLVSWRHYF
ncbi:MAG: tetratricopeptide repeat protein [Candidatus Acidiferrales bacterium]